MDSHLKPDFKSLISVVSEVLGKAELPFMLIGGQAVLLHGQPRLTEDIDITLGVSPEELSRVIRVCKQTGLEILPAEVEAFVQETFVLPTRDVESSIRIDFIFSSLPYEKQAIDRAVEVTLNDVPVPFASPEDLILHKLFSGRPRDIEDIQGVVLVKGEELDWDYIERWVKEFISIPGRENLLHLAREIKAGTPES